MWTSAPSTHSQESGVSLSVQPVPANPLLANIVLRIGLLSILIVEYWSLIRSHISRQHIMLVGYLYSLADYILLCDQVKQSHTVCDYQLEMEQTGGVLRTHGGYAEPLLLSIEA